MWLSTQERATLTTLGSIALLWLGILPWLQQRMPAARTPLAVHAKYWDDALARARQVDVNTADAAELERLPGIGPSLASRIVAYRTQHDRFHQSEELQDVRGVGPKLFSAIKDLIVVQ